MRKELTRPVSLRSKGIGTWKAKDQKSQGRNLVRRDLSFSALSPIVDR